MPWTHPPSNLSAAAHIVPLPPTLRLGIARRAKSESPHVEQPRECASLLCSRGWHVFLAICETHLPVCRNCSRLRGWLCNHRVFVAAIESGRRVNGGASLNNCCLRAARGFWRSDSNGEYQRRVNSDHSVIPQQQVATAAGHHSNSPRTCTRSGRTVSCYDKSGNLFAGRLALELRQCAALSRAQGTIRPNLIAVYPGAGMVHPSPIPRTAALPVDAALTRAPPSAPHA